MLAVAALLAAACGGGRGADVVVVGTEEPAPQESALPAAKTPEVSEPAASSAPPPEVPPPSTTQTIPTGPGGLARCDDVPKLESRLEGTLSGRQNPDPAVMTALLAYGRQQPGTYAGLWIDRDNGGVLMMGFTDDPEPHRAAILARRPLARRRPRRRRVADHRRPDPWASGKTWSSTWCRSGSARPTYEPCETR